MGENWEVNETGTQKALDEKDVRMAAITALVDEQAEDEGLWFIARTAPEAYLQDALRKLHRAIENDQT